MIMKSKVYKGYCNLTCESTAREEDLAFWLDLYLEYNTKLTTGHKV